MNALEAKEIKKSFGGVNALVNGELCCPQGQICGLLGANGSGKTTFSKILTGLLSPDGGVINLYGKQVSFKNPMDAKKAGIAMIHQSLSLIPDLTVWENITLGHEPLSKFGFLDNKSARTIAMDVLNKLDSGLDLNKKTAKLSPSEKQVVEIAKALSQKPKLLILDEPTAALEKTQVNTLFKLPERQTALSPGTSIKIHRLNSKTYQ